MTATNMDNVSDGYHTFGELYKHRVLLFINLAICNFGIAFKTRLNDKKEAWDGWFILGINTEFGQITYHVPNRYWEAINVREDEYNWDYDGHTSDDVCDRLLLFANSINNSKIAYYNEASKTNAA